MITHVAHWIKEDILSGNTNKDLYVKKYKKLTHVKFDGIKINNNNKSGVTISYLWKGIFTHWIEVDHIKIANDDTLNILGIEGRIGITLS